MVASTVGRGLRTRFADDLLWLPYLTAHFIQTTGDWSLLDERAPISTLVRSKLARTRRIYCRVMRANRATSMTNAAVPSTARSWSAIMGCRCSEAATGTTA